MVFIIMDENSYKLKLNHSEQLLNEAFAKYSEKEIFLSFNGGKDCTVLLDMVMKCVPKLINNSTNLKIIYVQPNQPFEEVEQFVEQCIIFYGVKIQIMKGGIRTVLEKLCREDPSVKACLMGSRRTDPYCAELEFMQETDSGWPKLMRINPLLDWKCADVWHYIRNNNVPYCKLYTSIGDKSNTVPNPHLKREGSTGGLTYLPAYLLENADEYERCGRT
ncbi:FAD synthase-like isoform X2 [Uranotaenia lowii]|uniref:FAD synthase-like isoform X2 n=1 Tax=Uranotaenia lowii TaxID=190385 RepID=UPI0024789880|nr:FAD synthase-like isoform X2 [Uranotaenia lowii]